MNKIISWIQIEVNTKNKELSSKEFHCQTFNDKKNLIKLEIDKMKIRLVNFKQNNDHNINF